MDESSQEVTNLFQTYGAVDQHLDALPSEDRDRISQLLPIYRDERPGWFEKFVTKEGVVNRSELVDPRTRIDKALDELAKTKPRGRMRARRLYAISVAAQAFPDLPSHQVAGAALGAGELGKGEEADARAEKLTALLRGKPESDDQAGRDASWDRVAGSELTPDGLGPRPCSGQLSWVTVDGDRDLVPTLKTVLDARLAFDAAKEFCLDPETWECFPSWCSMTHIGDENGFRQYQEVVSFDCDNKALPKLTVNLNFSAEEDDKPTRRVLTEYWRSDDQPEDYVEVNQGWLEVQELSADPKDPWVRVTTTKSVKFSDELGGPGLASMACRVGYLSLVGDLITCASTEKEARKKYPNVSFHGRTPPAEARGAARSPDLNYVGLVSLMVEEAGIALEDWIDEWAHASQGSYGELEKGYNADRLSQDMADYWLRTIRGGARFGDVGRRAVQAVPRVGGRRPASRSRRPRGRS